MEETPQHPLSEEEKAETVEAYIRARGSGPWRKNFPRELVIVGAVRMMQALGAYGRLSSLGKTKFKAYIPPVLRRLSARWASPALAGFPLLRRITDAAVLHIERENS
jgi:aminoglycoside/choline kinase family phosphotransferase